MIIHVVGARPNYVKAAPLIREIDWCEQLVINTSQHYSDNMSKDIMKSVGMPNPDIYLPVVKDDPISRFSKITEGLYSIIKERQPSAVVVYGDVDSTLSAAIATKKNGAKLVHIESGLRSFDDSMPEEVNRKMVDSVSDICFVTEESGLENLKGHTGEVLMVGNTMIDTLVWVKRAMGGVFRPKPNHEYILLTVHRPSNVDNEQSLKKIVDMCEDIDMKIVWPVHPRTMNNLKKYGLLERVFGMEHVCIEDPMTYISFLSYINNSFAVITDSGGIQEETTFLGVNCYTVRKNTERPVTINLGTNRLIEIEGVAQAVLEQEGSAQGVIPPLWDGKASERISSYLKELV